jgi:hypothetical protein
MRSGQLRYALRKFRERERERDKRLSSSVGVVGFGFLFLFLFFMLRVFFSSACRSFKSGVFTERGIEQKKTAHLTRRELRGIN